MNKRQIWQLVFITIVFAGLGWAFVLVLPFGLLAVQLYIGLLFIPFVTFIQLLITRHCEWPTCGHCGEIVDRKTMRKRAFGTTPNCPHCEKTLYENTKARSKYMTIYFFAPFIMFAPQLTQSVEMIALISYVFVYVMLVFTTLKYIDPYIVKFTDDDKIPPLW